MKITIFIDEILENKCRNLRIAKDFSKNIVNIEDLVRNPILNIASLRSVF